MNNLYLLALFLHVVGALSFFVALGLEWNSVRQLRCAEQVDPVRLAMRSAGNAGRLAMIGMVVLLLSGIYMMATVWRLVPWIGVALGTILLMALAMSLFTRRYMSAIARAVASTPATETSRVSPEVATLLRHPLLWLGIQLRVTLALGIVYLMTVKPDWYASLFAIAVACLLGLAASFFSAGRNELQREPAL